MTTPSPALVEELAGVDGDLLVLGVRRNINNVVGADVDICAGSYVTIVVCSDVTIVVEPLNRRECNVFTSVGECAEYVRQVDHANLRLLVDAYHWLLDNDSYQSIIRYGPLIKHVHIATEANRKSATIQLDEMIRQRAAA